MAGRARTVLLLVAVAVSGLASCAGDWPGRFRSDARQVDFATLGMADRLRVVSTLDGSVVAQTTAPDHVSTAARFARYRQDGWVEVFPGPLLWEEDPSACSESGMVGRAVVLRNGRLRASSDRALV